MAAFIIYSLGLAAQTAAGDPVPAGLPGTLRERWAAPVLELEGAWLLRAETTSDAIRDELANILGPDHRLLVVELGRDAAWAGLRGHQRDWLLENL